ncbi:hypothetical protein ACXU4B_00390 [Dyella soli]|nr:DoxX family membrane protein [Dyella soli]
MESSSQPYASPLRASGVIARASATAMRPAHVALAISMIALGILGFIYGDVALVWQRIPIPLGPGQTLLAYACAAIELGTGVGLLVRRSARPAALVLLVFLLLWAALLKLPAVVLVPQMEATWLGFGEIAVMLAGGWVLYAAQAGNHATASASFITGPRGIRCARLLFALALPMIGLSHFFYGEQTAALVPAWLPSRLGWAYLTGACSIAASLGVLLAICPRLAATLQAVMLGVITVLVWCPAIVAAPSDRTSWTAMVISFAIASGAWLIADTYRGTPWLAMGRRGSTLPAR